MNPMFHVSKKRLWSLIALTGMLLTAAPAVIGAPTESGINWSSGVISVVGEGVGPSIADSGKRRLLAKRAAIVDGYRKLAETVQGVHITSETRVKELEVESDEIRSTVSGLVKGAQIVEENITSDGVYEVRIEMPIFGEKSLASAVLATSLNRRKPAFTSEVAIAPPTSVTVSEGALPSAGKNHTGMIVDARNLRAKAAMMPTLFDETGRELYFGALSISNDDLVAQGPVSYVKSLDEAKQHPRVGSNPLIVRAKRHKGPFQADLILSADEAARVTAANQAGGFLANMAVVIVQ
jgi:hypothetical protein